MSHKEQTDAFSDDIDKLVERYRKEFDISYAQVLGVLQMKSWLLSQEASERSEEV